MNDALAVALAVLLLAGNAFFVGAEFALISTRREQLEPEVAAGTRGARTTLKALEQLSLMMAGAQLGITICSLGLGAVGEPAVAHLVERPFAAAGMPEELLHPVAFALALTIVVGLHMVLGEMVPKNVALAGPVRSALLLGPLLFAVVRLLRPVIAALNHLSNGVLRLLRVEPKDEVTSAYSADQVSDLVTESHDEGLLDEEEHQLLTGALQFEERTARAVTLPLDALVTVAPQATAGQLRDLCARTGFSRFPVRDAAELVGYVHVKDPPPPSATCPTARCRRSWSGRWPRSRPTAGCTTCWPRCRPGVRTSDGSRTTAAGPSASSPSRTSSRSSSARCATPPTDPRTRWALPRSSRLRLAGEGVQAADRPQALLARVRAAWPGPGVKSRSPGALLRPFRAVDGVQWW